MANNLDVLKRILENPCDADHRTAYDMWTIALSAGAEALPIGQEKTALLYLANNPGAHIILDNGDKVITRALKNAIELMQVGGQNENP